MPCTSLPSTFASRTKQQATSTNPSLIPRCWHKHARVTALVSATSSILADSTSVRTSPSWCAPLPISTSSLSSPTCNCLFLAIQTSRRDLSSPTHAPLPPNSAFQTRSSTASSKIKTNPPCTAAPASTSFPHSTKDLGCPP